MVYFTLAADAPLTVEQLSAHLKAEYNILMRPYEPRERKVRVVTHHGITTSDIQRTVDAMRVLLTANEPVPAE
jgi:hypothetical protein